MAAALRLNDGRNVFPAKNPVRHPAAAGHQRAGVRAGASRARRDVGEVGRAVPCAPVFADGHLCQRKGAFWFTTTAGRGLPALPSEGGREYDLTEICQSAFIHSCQQRRT